MTFQTKVWEAQKTMVVIPALFLLGSLLLCGHVEAESIVDLLTEAALKMDTDVTCHKWDCNCAFERQRGCCCAAQDMYKLEEHAFTKMKDLWHGLIKLKHSVHNLIDYSHVAFKANMAPGSKQCFGPFNTNVPIPYSIVTLNEDRAYNPAMGVFTAPSAGVYVFSFTVYSYVETDELLYHKVQLMKNGIPIVSVWENNREDYEDNGNQLVVLELEWGDNVYVEMMSGRKLCKYLEYNIFTGYMLYANQNPYPGYEYYHDDGEENEHEYDYK